MDPKDFERRVTSSGGYAPRLMVEYLCPNGECAAVVVKDAYDGPPTCGGWVQGDEKHLHTPKFMKAVRIVEP